MDDGESAMSSGRMAAAGACEPLRPELADVARLGRRLVRLLVATARAEDQPLQRLLLDHLGGRAAGLPVVTGSWAPYDHVNVQIGLDAWLAGPGRRHELVGGPDSAARHSGLVICASLPG